MHVCVWVCVCICSRSVFLGYFPPYFEIGTFSESGAHLRTTVAGHCTLRITCLSCIILQYLGYRNKPLCLGFCITSENLNSDLQTWTTSTLPTECIFSLQTITFYDIILHFLKYSGKLILTRLQLKGSSLQCCGAVLISFKLWKEVSVL